MRTTFARRAGFLSLGVVIFTRAAMAGGTAVPQTADADERVRQKALQTLRTALVAEERWIKVHAAEALLAAGYPQDVRSAFERELASWGAEPEYRIGIWRVLAQATRSAGQRASWIRKIAEAFLDTSGPDRPHAAETLGKLGYRARNNEVGAFDLVARTAPGPFATNARWVLVNSGRPGAEARLADLLDSSDPGARANAAYAMRFLRTLSPAVRNRLVAAAGKETGDEIVRIYLVSAAFAHAPADQRARLKASLLNAARSGSNDVKYEVCASLAALGNRDDLPLLLPLLDDSSADVRIGAAHAALRAGARAPRP